MSASEIEKIVCYECHAVLDLGDRYCRHCGVPTSRSAGAPRSSVVQVTHGLRPVESRIVILIMLFAVLGPLALPMLWRSPVFSRTWKVLLTLLVLALSVAIFGLLCYVVSSVIIPIVEALHPKVDF